MVDNDPALNVSLSIRGPDGRMGSSSRPTLASLNQYWPLVGEIAFNEIYPDAFGNDTDDWPNGEWIELINTGNQTVDLANWHFTSGSKLQY